MSSSVPSNRVHQSLGFHRARIYDAVTGTTMHRAPFVLPAVLVACVAAGAHPVSASERATATLAASARFNTRTSLTVSTDVLRFDVTTADAPAVVSVDFVAGARTKADGEVMLTVEPAGAIAGPGGAADVEASVEFIGEGEGTLAGPIDRASSSVAGRWSGSGRRIGRLRFTLRAGAAGTYTLPLRFVLTAP